MTTSSTTTELPLTSSDACNDAATCPQCGSAESWGSGSWCPACGYYPKFADHMPAQRIPAEPEAEPADDQARVPAWAVILLGGIAIIVVGSLGVRLWVYLNGGRRAFFALGEMLIGFCCLGSASLFALWHCRRSNKNASVFDVVCNPVNLWQTTLEYMPTTRKRLWFATWGLTMIIAANVCVGGIRYSGLWTNDWGFKSPPRKRNLLAQAVAASQGGKKTARDDGDLMEELDKYKENQAAGRPATPPTVEGVVYGFLADETLELGRILVARHKAGQLQHCAVIAGHTIDDASYTALARMAAENLDTEPAIRSLLNANWVRPVIRMKLRFEGVAGEGELVNPRFVSLPALDQDKRDKRAAEPRRRDRADALADAVNSLRPAD